MNRAADYGRRLADLVAGSALSDAAAAAALERYLDQDAARVKAEAARSLLVG